MRGPLYALVCVVVPAVWGTAMYFAFDLWERRRRRVAARLPRAVDYSI